MNRLLLTLLQSDLLPGLNPAPADTTKVSKAAADIALSLIHISEPTRPY